MTTFVAAGGIHSVPVGSPDGVYAHTINERGESKATYLGPHDQLSKTKRDDNTAGGSGGLVQSAKFAKRDQAYCDNNDPNPKYIVTADKNVAVDMVLNQTAGGYKFNHAISWITDTVTAFACDYGTGQEFNGQQFAEWVSSIDSECGANVGGYYDLPGSKSSYGRTTTGYEFCGSQAQPYN